MSEDLMIRAAEQGDAEAIVELLNPIIENGSYTVMDEPLTVDEQARFLRSFPPRGVYHVAVSARDGRVLGIQDVVPVLETVPAFRHVCEISTFVVLDAHRRGIGSRLSRATFRAAKDRGFRKIIATIRADNPQALSFYRSVGFETVGTARRHACVRGAFIDEIITERFID